MTLQYFLFDTYPGYFFLALPLALLGGLCYTVRYKDNPSVFPAALFVCWLTGLLSLTLFFDFLRAFWYTVLYSMPYGLNIHWFTLSLNLIPDFWMHFRLEHLGNLLLYLPFGILYPFFRKNRGKPCSVQQTLRAGLALSLSIELLQPVFGRSFDINDILLNGCGICLSAALYAVLCISVRRLRQNSGTTGTGETGNNP